MRITSVNERGVSIHAFRGEGDSLTALRLRFDQRFNPRLPGGRRRYASAPKTYARMFQSTPSGGKATSLADTAYKAYLVSIHAFRGEGDASVPSP